MAIGAESSTSLMAGPGAAHFLSTFYMKLLWAGPALRMQASPRRQLPTDALDAAAVAGALERAAGGGQRVPTSQLGM